MWMKQVIVKSWKESVSPDLFANMALDVLQFICVICFFHVGDSSIYMPRNLVVNNC